MRNNLLTLLVLLIVGFATIILQASATSANNACFQVKASQWGARCGGDPLSLEITVENTCQQKMSLLYCLEQEGGKKECNVAADIMAGDTTKVFTCKGTGNYEFIACEKSKDCKKELKKKRGPRAPF